MTRPRRLAPPEGLQAGGQEFWTAIIDKFALVDHELVILKEACRTIDLLDSLQAAIDRDGPLQRWGEGSRAHPAAPELRQHRIALARLVATLGIPDDPDSDRRITRGARGVYRTGRSASVGRWRVLWSLLQGCARSTLRIGLSGW
jgi:hypothetical protein